MNLVDDQQGAKSSDLAQVQVRSSRDRLIGRDITREPAAGVWLVLCSAQTEIVAQCGPPGRVCERFLGLHAQAVARHNPANAFNDPGLDQTSSGYHGKKGLAAS